MFKKSLATALLVVTVPAMANAAWFLTTQVTSNGGSLTSSNGVQSSIGTITKSYPASAITEQNPTAAANTGFTSRGVVVVDNDTKAALAVPFTPVDGHTYTVSAGFKVNSLPVSASINAGTVTPTSLGNIYHGYTLKSPLTFTFSPKAGYAITGITGAPAGITPVIPGGTNARATVTFPAGYTFTSSIALAGTAANLNPTLNAPKPVDAFAGAAVSLSASVANIADPAYAWTYVSGPANTEATVTNNGKVSVVVTPGPALTLTGANTATPSFTAPSVPGQYKFTVTVSGQTKLAVVNVYAAGQVGTQCQNCHTGNGIADPTIQSRYAASIHSNSTHSTCASCHFNGNTAGHPGTVSNKTVDPVNFTVLQDGVKGPYGNVANGAIFCTACHSGQYAIPHATTGLPTSCVNCHTQKVVDNVAVANGTDAHGIVEATCVGCHAIPRNAGAGFVQDNNGVRAITTEFDKWSHHVTGVTLNDAHCAACHLEGKVEGGKVVADFAVHMTDAKVHLRNADTDADMQWDPMAPDHSTMDNFCMSCHDGNGATSAMSAQIQAFINTNGLAAAGKTASAKNPFGDTISNRYDKMQRPAVVNVDSQFNLTNNSHHGVKGPRYTKRTRVVDANDPRAMTVEQSAAFAANSSALLKGKRSTIYDMKIGVASPTSILNQLYVPLENAGGEVAPRTGDQTLGDDSTLHCGDCHTVGQWKVGSSVDRLGNATPDAIGAHGSNNEYLLRNSKGTDERHTQNAYTLAGGVVTWTNPNGAFLVCYNCHTYAQYGSVYNATGGGQTAGATAPHAGEYDQAGRCDGVGNTLPFYGFTTGTATDGTQFVSRFDGPISKYGKAAPYAGEQNPDFGNIFGIQCLNCHNSGLGNGYGGIHGSANNTNRVDQEVDPSVTGGAYIDGMGNTTKVQRFLPGLGNAAHVPGTLGGITGGTAAFFNGSTASNGTYITGGISNDTNWEQKHWQQTASTQFTATAATGTLTSAGAGCYTLGEGTSAAASKLEGPSVTGENGPATEGFGIWGGCDDHDAAQGKGDHGFLKRVVRPITY